MLKGLWLLLITVVYCSCTTSLDDEAFRDNAFLLGLTGDIELYRGKTALYTEAAAAHFTCAQGHFSRLAHVDSLRVKYWRKRAQETTAALTSK